MRDRIAITLALLLLSALSVARVSRPPRPVAATSPDTVFSAERAMRYVEDIAIRPHAMGMPDHDRVRDYIVGQLNALNLRPQIQTTTGVGTRYQVAGRVQNILAWLPGVDAHGKAVLLVAHYDGVEGGPAAGDNGSGTAALLETLRALRARKTALAHDVIGLFTDGEETGLLGAAAFVREHPWAKDVAVVLNFDTRGTSGRSVMFETGVGNRDAVSVLRSVGDATAGSVFTTIYRTLPNDTDLSELSMLGQPAMNFAFVDGIERYHTSNDDVAHLDPGSLQHQGEQMLGLARAFGSGTLPRPRTGDAVFFDLPLIGLVVYPESLAIPLAIVMCLAVGAAVFRSRRGVIAGVVVTLVAVVASASAAFAVTWIATLVLQRLHWSGDPQWRGLYALAVSIFCMAVVLALASMAKRWTHESGVWMGAIVVCAIAGLALSIVAPGASYLFVWPALLAAVAVLTPARARPVVEWIAIAVTILLLIGFAYGVSVVMLGIAGVGAVALGVLTATVVLLVLPRIEAVMAGVEWNGAEWLAAASAVILTAVAITTRPGPDHPVPTALVYAVNADSGEGWFGTYSGVSDNWSQRVIAPFAAPPAWTRRVSGTRGLVGHPVARVSLDAPAAALVRDTIIASARRLVFRVHAPPGATNLVMRALGAHVSSSSIDGRVVDTTRYRRRPAEWSMPYWAVPDTGAIVALSVPTGSHIELELVSRQPGLPKVPGLTVPPRPPQVVQAQFGDATYIYRRLVF